MRKHRDMRGAGAVTRPALLLGWWRFAGGVCSLLAVLVAPLMGRAVAQGQTPPSRADVTAQRRAVVGNLIGHGGPIKAIRVDAASRRALTGSFDYAAMLWDLSVEPPRQLLRLDQHNAAVNAVAFVDGNRALTAGDDSVVRLWDLTNGTLLRRFEGHDAGSKIVAITVSTDGKWAATAGWDRTARLWDLDSGRAGPVVKEHGKPVNGVAFSRDGSHLLTASADGTVGLSRVSDGQFVRPLLNVGWGVNVIERIGVDDRFAVGALDGSVNVIDLASGTTTAVAGHQRPVLAITTLDRPGLIATGGGDGSIHLLRAADGSKIEDYKHAFGPVWALAMRPVADGQPIALYYGGLDDFATLWQAAPRKAFEEVDGSQFPRRFQKAGKGDDAVARGEVQFARKCSICHALTAGSANRAGPSLHKIFGRRIATLPGYPYSPELRLLDIVWSDATIGKLFELGPDKFTPGSKMPLQVMADQGERDALIAYLKVATE